jgi:hypothetical protein
MWLQKQIYECVWNQIPVAHPIVITAFEQPQLCRSGLVFEILRISTVRGHVMFLAPDKNSSWQGDGACSF